MTRCSRALGYVVPLAMGLSTAFGGESEIFTDDFNQAPGNPANWTIYKGSWAVSSKRLVLTPDCLSTSRREDDNFIWAGRPARPFQSTVIECRISLSNTTGGPLGRHGGICFCVGNPTSRWLTTGYLIDWVDRQEDRGYRFTRYDNGPHTLILHTGNKAPLESNWLVEIRPATIRFFAGGSLVFEVEDDHYRGGYVGIFGYCNGTRVEVDDVSITEPPAIPFRRGDVNADATLNISDPIFILNYQFGSGPSPTCLKTADVNDNGVLNLADPIWLLAFLFSGGPTPPEPLSECGTDPTADKLTCESHPPCP